VRARWPPTRHERPLSPRLASLLPRDPAAALAPAGGYLIVEREADEEAEGREVGKVQATLVHYLYRDQIRHLQSRSLWPSAFADGDGAAAADEYGSEALHTNTNHAFRDLPPSSDESEGGEEGEEEEEEEEEEELDALGNSVVRRG